MKPENSHDINGRALDGSRVVEFKDVVINNPISLYCETNAVPPPSLTWYKDGKLLTSNGNVLILPGMYILTDKKWSLNVESASAIKTRYRLILIQWII